MDGSSLKSLCITVKISNSNKNFKVTLLFEGGKKSAADITECCLAQGCDSPPVHNSCLQVARGCRPRDAIPPISCRRRGSGPHWLTSLGSKAHCVQAGLPRFLEGIATYRPGLGSCPRTKDELYPTQSSLWARLLPGPQEKCHSFQPS